ncbi:MAG: MgtC/SapB family protein, partial [Kiloniellales bacterium]
METLKTLLAADLNASNAQAVVRLLVAALLAMVIGIDREARNKPAGLRSHMLVSLAAALLTVVTFRIADAASQLGEAVNADPLRIVEAVVAGVA